MTANTLDQKDHVTGLPDLSELTRLADETSMPVIPPKVTAQIAEVRRVCEWAHVDMGRVPEIEAFLTL